MYFSKLLLSDIVEFAVSKGIDRDDLLKSLNIELSGEIDPMEHINYDQMVEVLNTVKLVINDNFLGLHLGEQMMLKATKMVDNIMLNSPTVEEAFSNAVNYSKLISDALTSHLSKTTHHTKVSFSVNPNWSVHPNHPVQQIIDMTLVCTLKSIFWLTSKKHSPMEIHLNYPSLKRKNEYYRVFDCSIKFKESIPGIIFQNPIFNQSISSNNSSLLANLKKIADEEIDKIQTEHSLIISIKEIVLNNLPQKISVAKIASQLHLSSRTLQRKLQQIETTFKEIEKDILLKLAITFILHEKRDIDEISYLLGFSEASAFIRFFKNEVKITPNKYRKLKVNHKET